MTKSEYKTIKSLCHIAKNLTNEALYNIRQHYFDTGSYLNYYDNYRLVKNSPNYKMLNSNIAQQIIKEVDGSFKSFFSLLKLAKDGKYAFKDCRIPHYLPKNGYAALVIGYVRIKNHQLILPYSNAFKKTHSPIKIQLPPILADKQIKQIRIIPKSNAGFFEIQYTYKAECLNGSLDINNALSLDFGVDNLITAVSSTGRSFIIDGKRLKSINQWYNKENARLQSIKDKQHFKGTTKRQHYLTANRNNKVNDYISKAAKKTVDYCINHNIGTLIAGYNQTFQRSSHIGKRNNQMFVGIPFARLLSKLEYLCQLNDIRFIKQEESYTSKASFWDKDELPVYDTAKKSYHFSGKRIHRGLYQTSSGKVLNADVNGALNIMRKCNVVSLETLYNRGDVDTPIRIRIA